MSGDGKSGRSHAAWWTLAEVAAWISTGDGAAIARPDVIQQSALDDLQAALERGDVQAFGCVDGATKRKIDPVEWTDYRFVLMRTPRAGRARVGRSALGPTHILTLSKRGFSAASVRERTHPSGSLGRDGEPLYLRLVTLVVFERRAVMKAWHPPAVAVATVAAETSCQLWLIVEMRASPAKSPDTKSNLCDKALKMFPGLSKKAFNRAWGGGIEETGAQWARAGRPSGRAATTVKS